MPRCKRGYVNSKNKHATYYECFLIYHHTTDTARPSTLVSVTQSTTHFLLLLVPSSSLEYPLPPLEEPPSESELTVCTLDASALEVGLSTPLSCFSEGFFPPILKLKSSDSAIISKLNCSRAIKKGKTRHGPMGRE